MTETVARRLMERVAAAWEAEGSSYLDPSLAALCEAFFFSRNPPLGKRETPLLPGMEAVELQGKALCASVEGFSLHAAQSVAADDREGLECLLRYGLRAPFSQERLSLRSDGKVVYRLRRPWPNVQGATHLILEPLDFLRRLAALVSFPYSHQIHYHGLFAGRSRLRRFLPPPPPRLEERDVDDVAPAVTDVAGRAAAEATEETPSPARRRRVPWAQLLLRLLHIDALACPRCSTPKQSVPMVVLAFLTDPDVVGRILRCLGLPTCAPALAPAGYVPCREVFVQRALAFSSPAVECGGMREQEVSGCGEGEEGSVPEASQSTTIRPPP